jgi:hypothetical protein
MSSKYSQAVCEARGSLRLLLGLFLAVAVAPSAWAETFACPWADAEVSLRAGPEQKLVFNGVEFYNHPGFPNRLSVQPDMGGDYDELAPRYEWNGLNTKEVTPIFALCQNKGNELVEIEIPQKIHRCLQPKKAGFSVNPAQYPIGCIQTAFDLKKFLKTNLFGRFCRQNYRKAVMPWCGRI